MANPLFLTMGLDENYGGMVLDHELRHKTYCKKWDYDYHKSLLVDIPIEFDRLFRIRAILYFMKTENYSHVFWIDADTFVADFSHDMRETLPEWAWLGMAAHPYSWHPKRWIDAIHLQCGIFYFRVCDEAIAFIERIIELKDYAADDQTIINHLLLENQNESDRWQRGFKLLSYRWNNTLHDQNHSPIIAAFHGYLAPPERRAHMREVAAKYPYGENNV